MADVADEVINSFRNQMRQVAESPLVMELTDLLSGIAYSCTEAYLQFTDALAACLGGDAANQCVNQADQNAAITGCECFVSEEVSSSPSSLAAALVVAEGPQRARDIVREVLAQSPALDSYGPKRQ